MCDLCLGSKLVRKNTISGTMIPFLPKRLRDIDRDDNWHKTISCPECENHDGKLPERVSPQAMLTTKMGASQQAGQKLTGS